MVRKSARLHNFLQSSRTTVIAIIPATGKIACLTWRNDRHDADRDNCCGSTIRPSRHREDYVASPVVVCEHPLGA